MVYICKCCNKSTRIRVGWRPIWRLMCAKSPNLFPAPKEADLELKPYSKSRQLPLNVSNNASLDLHPRKSPAATDPHLLRVNANPSASSASDPLSSPHSPRRLRHYRKKFQDMNPLSSPQIWYRLIWMRNLSNSGWLMCGIFKSWRNSSPYLTKICI